jgi:hypothetical protein
MIAAARKKEFEWSPQRAAWDAQRGDYEKAMAEAAAADSDSD